MRCTNMPSNLASSAILMTNRNSVIKQAPPFFRHQTFFLASSKLAHVIVARSAPTYPVCSGIDDFLDPRF